MKRILEKTVSASRKDWSAKLDEALWAYRTTYKSPIGLTPFQMVYGKSCHLPVELEHKAFWALKFLNFDQEKAGEKRKVQMHELEEMRNQAYESSKLYKEKVKKYHDKKIIQRQFKPGQMVLLFNSWLRLFPGKLKSKWSRPFIVKEVNSRFMHIRIRSHGAYPNHPKQNSKSKPKTKPVITRDASKTTRHGE